MGDAERDDDTRASKRETLAHLVPRVVVRAPFTAKELGAVRDLSVRHDHVAVIFEGEIELRFYGDSELWTSLLAKVHAGELSVSGDRAEEWTAIAAEVAGHRRLQ